MSASLPPESELAPRSLEQLRKSLADIDKIIEVRKAEFMLLQLRSAQKKQKQMDQINIHPDEEYVDLTYARTPCPQFPHLPPRDFGDYIDDTLNQLDSCIHDLDAVMPLKEEVDAADINIKLFPECHTNAEGGVNADVDSVAHTAKCSSYVMPSLLSGVCGDGLSSLNNPMLDQPIGAPSSQPNTQPPLPSEDIAEGLKNNSTDSTVPHVGHSSIHTSPALMNTAPPVHTNNTADGGVDSRGSTMECIYIHDWEPNVELNSDVAVREEVCTSEFERQNSKDIVNNNKYSSITSIIQTHVDDDVGILSNLEQHVDDDVGILEQLPNVTVERQRLFNAICKAVSVCSRSRNWGFDKDHHTLQLCFQYWKLHVERKRLYKNHDRCTENVASVVSIVSLEDAAGLHDRDNCTVPERDVIMTPLSTRDVSSQTGTSPDGNQGCVDGNDMREKRSDARDVSSQAGKVPDGRKKTSSGLTAMGVLILVLGFGSMSLLVAYYNHGTLEHDTIVHSFVHWSTVLCRSTHTTGIHSTNSTAEL